MSNHSFPEIAPEVIVTPKPEANFKEVLRVDAGGFFVPLQVGAQARWSFYDWPEKKLSEVCHTKVVGTIKVHGKECIELIDRCLISDAGWWARWIYCVSDEKSQIVSFESHGGKGSKIEDVEATPMPLRLKIGREWQGHEIYRCGAEVRGENQKQYGLVDGPFEVLLPAGRMLCLRETWWTIAADGRGFILAELYVAENGRSMLFRRFNGPAYHNYEELTGNPEREHEGVTWRLWYECLPDIALGGKP